MVKTRHEVDMDASPGSEFLSLRTRSSKRQSRSDAEENFLSSGDENTPRSKRQKMVSVRASGMSSDTPTRATPRRSYRKDEEETPESRVQEHYSTRSRSRTSMEAKVSRGQAPSTSMNQSPPTPVLSQERKEAVLTRSREYRSLTSDGLVDVIENNEDEDGIRRSRRARKQIYGTMNQNLLTEMMLAGGTNPSPEEVIVGKKRQIRPPLKQESDNDEDDEEEDEEKEKESESGLDMYSRIKNRHISKKKREQEKTKELEEGEEEDDEDEEDDSDEDDSDEDDSDEDDSEGEEEEHTPQYSLRQHRTITDRYSAPLSESQRRRPKNYEEFINPHSPLRRHRLKHKKHLTPVRSPQLQRRKHHAAHNLSSTSSDDSDDERRFERRKNKSMARARNRCLPMNLNPEDLASGVLKDRQRIGSSLADVDPMNIDTSVTFDSVGGLGSHVQALKEMVVFPLLYPEVFERFKISPPRGVLFHGPPGTGKTLVARALANECRQGNKRVAFFMRKGADCLSKWVGESERQLRLLFDQAFTMRPSIIFFDEIDGLAPVRSSRQDQIHSSIVSTLLALMDGLDSRGEVVVIGATNRIDAIDPALRRPGRFDREFLFPLPSLEARSSILTIHTSQWNPQLAQPFLVEVAERCVGYCGADLKALCTEAALFALRRRYPQIYTSKEKLQLDVNEIQVSAGDFQRAMGHIVPASQRSVVSPGRSLSARVRPLLLSQFNAALNVLHRVFPEALYRSKTSSSAEPRDPPADLLNSDEQADDGVGPSIFNGPLSTCASKKHSSSDTGARSFFNFMSTSLSQPYAHRPRFLITGKTGMGQSSHLAPALLHHMERLPVHCLDLPALYACSAKTPEESCAQVFREARRTSPSIIYIPHVNQWWEACTATLQATFLTLLQDLPPSAPILILATSNRPFQDTTPEVKSLFATGHGEVMNMQYPRMEERRTFFRDLILSQAAQAPPRRKQASTGELEVLPVAAPAEPRVLSQAETQKLMDEEERKLRELRIFLRDVLTRLASERKFRVFTSPVDPEEVPDYAEVIKNPMDLFTMNNKINLHQYTSARQFLSDIDLITSNALEYNPDREPSDRMIRNRACELKDMAYAIIDAEMDSDFEKDCEEIEDSRSRRCTTPTKTAPSFYKTVHQHTVALAQQQARELANQNLKPHQLAVDSRQRGELSDTESTKKPKKKPSKRRSAWSRGFLSKKKKKKPQAVADDNEDEDSGEEEEEEKENGETDKTTVEDEEEEMHNRPLTNGDIFHETSNDSTNAPSTLSQITDDAPHPSSMITTRLTRLATGVSSEHTTNYTTEQRSDAESVKSGPRTRHSSHRSDCGGQRSPHRLVDHCEIQNGFSSAESSEVEPPTLEKVEPFSQIQNEGSRLAGGDEKAKNSTASGTEPTPTSADSIKDKDMNGMASLRRSSRQLAKSLQTKPVTVVTGQTVEEVTPPMIVDRGKLERLLEDVTIATASFTIEKLERLYSVLSQCVYVHRLAYDKTELIQEMEGEVAKITVHSLV
ncbi:ATPase family AAA domain-containing protein 2-like [Diadema antillarum]|uniref:ATPase family AAA domain-containing protein 2-like n=1 Tax=Diadema antillarum TaxID=105358 RepID=UPI003A8A0B23